MREKGLFESEGLKFWGRVDGEFDWCEINYQHQVAGIVRRKALSLTHTRFSIPFVQTVSISSVLYTNYMHV